MMNTIEREGISSEENEQLRATQGRVDEALLKGDAKNGLKGTVLGLTVGQCLGLLERTIGTIAEEENAIHQCRL